MNNLSLEELRVLVNSYRAKYGVTSFAEYEDSLGDSPVMNFSEVSEWRNLEMILTSVDRKMY